MRMRTNSVLARALALQLVAAAGVLGTGCDQPSAKSGKPATPQAVATADVPSPDAQPAGSTQPHPARAETQPANAYLTIDGKITEFPPARLRLTKTDEGVTAILYSDDPPNATSASYTGNGFYFDLALRASDPENIDGAEYYYKADDSEPSESLNGILLHGTRYHLQPQDVMIRFDADGRKVMAQITGRFLVVQATSDKDDGALGHMAAVQGTLYTTAEVKEKR
jgi:hypothetical protein